MWPLTRPENCQPEVSTNPGAVPDVARRALAAASSSNPQLQFEKAWVEACLLSHALSFSPIVDHADDLSRTHRHLADVELAFSHADMSIARTAKAMHIHANTVTYRLDRWSKVACWKVRTFDGLIKSVIATRVADSSV